MQKGVGEKLARGWSSQNSKADNICLVEFQEIWQFPELGAFKSENELNTIYFSKIEIRYDVIYIPYNIVDVLGVRWREEVGDDARGAVAVAVICTVMMPIALVLVVFEAYCYALVMMVRYDSMEQQYRAGYHYHEQANTLNLLHHQFSPFTVGFPGTKSLR